VQGADEAVARIVAWSSRGPAGSRVDRVEVDEVDADAALGGFDQAPTA
jgi:hypothetical protein